MDAFTEGGAAGGAPVQADPFTHHPPVRPAGAPAAEPESSFEPGTGGGGEDFLYGVEEEEVDGASRHFAPSFAPPTHGYFCGVVVPLEEVTGGDSPEGGAAAGLEAAVTHSASEVPPVLEEETAPFSPPPRPSAEAEEPAAGTQRRKRIVAAPALAAAAADSVTKVPCVRCGKIFLPNAGIGRHLTFCKVQLSEEARAEVTAAALAKDALREACPRCGLFFSAGAGMGIHRSACDLVLPPTAAPSAAPSAGIEDAEAPDPRKAPCSGCGKRIVVSHLGRHQQLCTSFKEAAAAAAAASPAPDTAAKPVSRKRRGAGSASEEPSGGDVSEGGAGEEGSGAQPDPSASAAAAAALAASFTPVDGEPPVLARYARRCIFERRCGKKGPAGPVPNGWRNSVSKSRVDAMLAAI